jgi:hypothetical protein
MSAFLPWKREFESESKVRRDKGPDCVPVAVTTGFLFRPSRRGLQGNLADVTNLNVIDGYSRPPAVIQGNGKQSALLFELIPRSPPDGSIMFRNGRRLLQKPALADPWAGENRDLGRRWMTGAEPQPSDFSHGRKAIGG